MKEVTCQKHGVQQRYAIICRHLLESLNTGKTGGFFIPHEDIPVDEPEEAWCTACENILEKEEGWNDKSEAFADFSLVCEKCYDHIREINFSE